MALTWQPSLLDDVDPGVDLSFRGSHRRELGDGAWLDEVPGWVHGADALFARLLEVAPWSSHERRMYDRIVVEPRLTTRAWPDPPDPIPAMVRALSGRYGCDLSVVSANLYRDGGDSVAWHGDRIGREREETVVAILSLGSQRQLLMRPAAGGRPSLRLMTRPGDLLVMGGTCQRTWQHSIPKRASAGPRISVMFREGY